MPYRDLFEKFEGKHDFLDDIHCPVCGGHLKVCRRDYLHTMTKHRFICRPCEVYITIKTEKEKINNENQSY